MGFDTMSMGVGKMFLHGWNRLETAVPLILTDFVQSQDPGVKKWDLCSKHGGFVPFRQRPKANEKIMWRKCNIGFPSNLVSGAIFNE